MKARIKMLNVNIWLANAAQKSIKLLYGFMILSILICCVLFVDIGYGRDIHNNYLPTLILIPFGMIFMFGILTCLESWVFSSLLFFNRRFRHMKWRKCIFSHVHRSAVWRHRISNKVSLSSRAAAVNAGYRACSNCKPWSSYDKRYGRLFCFK